MRCSIPHLVAVSQGCLVAFVHLKNGSLILPIVQQTTQRKIHSPDHALPTILGQDIPGPKIGLSGIQLKPCSFGGGGIGKPGKDIGNGPLLPDGNATDLPGLHFLGKALHSQGRKDRLQECQIIQGDLPDTDRDSRRWDLSEFLQRVAQDEPSVEFEERRSKELKGHGEGISPPLLAP
jgi:hypothetical protein